jgi:hypothetical protein
MYRRWLKVALRNEVAALPGPGPYKVKSWLIGAGEVEQAKEEILGGPHFEDFAEYLEDGNTKAVLDLTRSYGKTFDFGHVGGAREDRSFEAIFPGCLPIALGEDDEDDELREVFYFIDTRRPGDPVLYWDHDMFAVIASDLSSFLSAMVL